MPRRRILTIPNVISVGRLACAPVFCWLLFDGHRIAAFALLGGLGATDWVDGWIARRFDQGTELGKVLDPVADRILLVTAAEVETIRAALVALPGQIPQIRAYAVGSDLGIMDGNADFAIVADFDDADALRRYQDHPAHRAVLTEQILPILASRVAVQLEIGP